VRDTSLHRASRAGASDVPIALPVTAIAADSCEPLPASCGIPAAMGTPAASTNLNQYSERWFDIFGNTVEPSQTQRDGPSQPRDSFNWRLYSHDELARCAASAGLRLRHSCCEFDESRPPSPDVPRTQFIMDR
jgi:hypothetical protein